MIRADLHYAIHRSVHSPYVPWFHVDRVYGGRRMGAEPLSCGAHGARWRALIGQGDVAGSLGFHRLEVRRHLPTARSTKEETERSDRERGREGRRESESGEAERERLPSVLVAAAEGVLSFSRNKSRETEGVGRRWSLLSAALGGTGRAAAARGVGERGAEQRGVGGGGTTLQQRAARQRWVEAEAGEEEGRAPGGALRAAAAASSRG